VQIDVIGASPASLLFALLIKRRFPCRGGVRHLVIYHSIADIALLVAKEGGFPLDDIPKIRAWIKVAKTQPGFIPII
jgi:hypothetical protein